MRIRISIAAFLQKRIFESTRNLPAAHLYYLAFLPAYNAKSYVTYYFVRNKMAKIPEHYQVTGFGAPRVAEALASIAGPEPAAAEGSADKITLPATIVAAAESKAAAGGSGSATGPDSGERLITLAELRKHNTADDCWIAITGVVYDVAYYLEEHPGGPEQILGVAGRDATELFEDIGHSRTAKKLLEQMRVGKLVK